MIFTEEQAVIYTQYVFERNAADLMKAKAKAPTKGTDIEQFLHMASMCNHAAGVLEQIALVLWSLDFADIYNDAKKD